MTPFFSVIITTYNRANLISRALTSLIKQECTLWEAIVIDDGSTDTTSDVMKLWLESGYPIIYQKQKNQGEAGAKNRGIALAKGRYITFLDSDDEYRKDHLKLRKEILEEHPEADLLHGGVTILGNEYVPDKHNPQQQIHLSECIIGGTFFIKKEKIRELNGFIDMPIATDSNLYDRAQQAGFSILKTLKPTYIYHRTETDSITHLYSESIKKRED